MHKYFFDCEPTMYFSLLKTKRLAMAFSLMTAFTSAHASLLSSTFTASDDSGMAIGGGKLVYDVDTALQSARVSDFTLSLSDGVNEFTFQTSDISEFAIQVDGNGKLTSFGATGTLPIPGIDGFSNYLYASGQFGGSFFYFPEGHLAFVYAFDAPVAQTPDAKVPEPVSLGLFGVGLAGLMSARRRTR